MRFSAVTAVAVATFATSSNAAAACSRWQTGLVKAYTVEATGVPDRAATCGSLWSNMKRFVPCAVPTFAECSGKNRNLYWTFQASSECNGGMVESVWWEVTKNAYGGIDCP